MSVLLFRSVLGVSLLVVFCVLVYLCGPMVVVVFGFLSATATASASIAVEIYYIRNGNWFVEVPAVSCRCTGFPHQPRAEQTHRPPTLPTSLTFPTNCT